MGRFADFRQRAARWLYEAMSGTALGDFGTSGDPELVGYTRLTGFGKNGKVLRDLTPWSQESMLKIAHFLYTQNPLATRLIEQPIDLAIGSEVGYTVEFDHRKLNVKPEAARELAAEAKVFLDQFWDHPAHDIRNRAGEYMTTLRVTGELCLPIASENDVSGVPQLDYLDSQLIQDVAPLDQSSMVPGVVLVRSKSGMGEPTPKKIVRFDVEAERLVGECFYWRNGRLLNSMRGRSELLNIADFLDSLDQFMFAQVDRAILLNNVVWRLKMEGANQATIDAAVKQLRGELGKPGGVWAGNEKSELEAVSHNLGANEAAELLRTLGNHIKGSKGQPESWFGDGGNANRATAGDQTDVSYKGLIALQSLAKRIFGTMLAYAYDNLQERQEGAGFPKRADGGVILTVDLPPISERDMSRAAAALTQVAAGAASAVADGLLSSKTARKLVIAVIEKTSGMALDADDEEAEIAAEQEERDKEDAERAEFLARRGLKDALDKGGDDDPPPDPPPPPPPPPPAPPNGNGSTREAHVPIERLTELVAAAAGVQPREVHFHAGDVRVDQPPPVVVPPAAVTVAPQAPPVNNLVMPAAVTPPAVTVESHVHVPPAAVEVNTPPPGPTVSEQTIERDEHGNITKTTTTTKPATEE